MQVDKAELARIANQAESMRRARAKEEQARVRQERFDLKRNAHDVAANIIKTVPGALLLAAETARRTSKGLEIVARIPIVNEEMTSIMSSRGYLSEKDEYLLKAVKRKLKLKSSRIRGVTLSIKDESRDDTFQSADGLDQATGPCKYFYLEAKTRVS